MATNEPGVPGGDASCPGEPVINHATSTIVTAPMELLGLSVPRQGRGSDE
ncbi:hypothetical protein ACN28S_54285 [Cystobacter fuscus]